MSGEHLARKSIRRVESNEKARNSTIKSKQPIGDNDLDKQ